MIRTLLIIMGVFGLLLSSYPSIAQENGETGDADKDKLYVTDQLRLSLYDQPSDRSRAIKLLTSGDELLIEEISGSYALVTTGDGSKGWVKRGFLVSIPTASRLLVKEKEKVLDLQLEIEKLNNSKVIIDQYEKDMDALVKKVEELQTDRAAAEEEINALMQEVEEKQAEIDHKTQINPLAFTVLWETAVTYWRIIIPIVLVIMLLSFLVSKKIVETHIKKRFHGIKIW